ncbi:MAG: 7-cyano-7-deazaguanine synthase QueC [Sulfuricurvum sp.]|uniref:7-cyano-7-deazaguanine synthase QueC n=1 Tax=Sulfuricurvum sp. TaxID=2025608 RepID=UPI002608D2CB|nr:7-cyano-7-deazaguanine synthase QueC [Sulfuricurvum sp.]MDD5117610.1 7-cyano-7-deazaguanine synthase QueC [Sulfuricurvum sp.]
MNKKALCIMSGGMDSTLVAYIMHHRGYEIVGLHFNYGQRTVSKELSSFRTICEELGVLEKYEIDLDFFKTIGASALTDHSLSVPTEGIEPGVPITYVPFRNGIFLSIATAIAEKEGCEVIAIGVVEEDSSGYPDCREAFIDTFNKAANLGTKETTHISIEMPLVHLQKSQIVQEALLLGVPLHMTWSCYQSEESACGVCDSCRLRLRGFERAGAVDPINYV